jgi:hypothetical protein
MSGDRSPHLTCDWQAPADWDALEVNGDVPDGPGFYAFTNHDGPLTASGQGREVLYIGIATTSLRDRMRKYRTGDASGISNMHRGGLMMFLSRAGAAHFGSSGRMTHSVQRKPIDVRVRSASGADAHSVLEPKKIYLRWAVDYRAAIEALLIRDLRPKYNTMHNTGG